MIFLKKVANTDKTSKQVLALKFSTLLCTTFLFIATSVNAAAVSQGSEILNNVIVSKVMPSNAQPLAQLKVTPKPCVALRKGQKCYLEVNFSWQHPQVSDYCLVNTTTSKIIKCWQQQGHGQFNLDFQSKLTNDFSLRHKASNKDLASTQIPVAWVYKSSKRAKSTWRLF